MLYCGLFEIALRRRYQRTVACFRGEFIVCQSKGRLMLNLYCEYTSYSDKHSNEHQKRLIHNSPLKKNFYQKETTLKFSNEQ